MNNYKTNEMNIEDYEDKATKRSKLAKGLGIAAGAVGIGAASSFTTYAATSDGASDVDGSLTADDMMHGAEVGNEIQPVEETTQNVYVQTAAPAPQAAAPVAEQEPEIVWEETTNYYNGDDKVMSIEEGTIDGHKFMLADIDGDERGDLLAIDLNDNGEFEADEVQGLSLADNVPMGHKTAHVTEEHYAWNPQEPDYHDQYAYNDATDHQIHNNFEDEKTGEEYHSDYAENNPDYNPHANVDYTAETADFDETGEYQASIDGMEENVADQPDLADASDADFDSFDSHIDSDEFLG